MNRAFGHDSRPACGELSDLRTSVRDRLTAWGLAGLAEDACLVITELVANAYHHGRPPVRVALTLSCLRGAGRCLRIEVSDSGPAIDVGVLRARWRHPSFDLTETGRGLSLVDAVCRAWGDRPAVCGHTVWAELTLPD